MRAWPVPVQISDEEKLIGGVISLRQLGWLFAGFCFGGLGAALPLPLALRFAVFVLVFLVGAVLAFASPFDTPLDVFLWRWWRWRRSPQELFLRGGQPPPAQGRGLAEADRKSRVD
ncbi:MAG: PrgI family protein [Bacillota bacterium]|nr:PrgI family protein [Bacillota bacterium]